MFSTVGRFLPGSETAAPAEAALSVETTERGSSTPVDIYVERAKYLQNAVFFFHNRRSGTR